MVVAPPRGTSCSTLQPSSSSFVYEDTEMLSSTDNAHVHHASSLSHGIYEDTQFNVGSTVLGIQSATIPTSTLGHQPLGLGHLLNAAPFQPTVEGLLMHEDTEFMTRDIIQSQKMK
jgi:hypothetical protein